jgi:hypothetical protein
MLQETGDELEHSRTPDGLGSGDDSADGKTLARGARGLQWRAKPLAHAGRAAGAEQCGPPDWVRFLFSMTLSI